MRIHVATDHAGLEFSQTVIRHLSDAGHEVIDHGPDQLRAARRLPVVLHRARPGRSSRDQRAGHEALGVVFGGSGNGEQIAANKVEGVRAALVWNDSTAKLARQHNDANVISIGARQHTEAEALAFIDAFVAEPFSRRGAPRAPHRPARRVRDHRRDRRAPGRLTT